MVVTFSTLFYREIPRTVCLEDKQLQVYTDCKFIHFQVYTDSLKLLLSLFVEYVITVTLKGKLLTKPLTSFLHLYESSIDQILKIHGDLALGLCHHWQYL